MDSGYTILAFYRYKLLESNNELCHNVTDVNPRP